MLCAPACAIGFSTAAMRHSVSHCGAPLWCSLRRSDATIVGPVGADFEPEGLLDLIFLARDRTPGRHNPKEGARGACMNAHAVGPRNMNGGKDTPQASPLRHRCERRLETPPRDTATGTTAASPPASSSGEAFLLPENFGSRAPPPVGENLEAIAFCRRPLARASSADSAGSRRGREDGHSHSGGSQELLQGAPWGAPASRRVGPPRRPAVLEGSRPTPPRGVG
ncbi:unnamed protein product [Prorocentrum cordatum]|uniref:Uncharacterized protein n=1 Tax=Prorocentrum cordatum TaxID=2364126 RepID=A0ABN9XLB7_9DINO|nr:unnamed protein product [Polarella glacialis]